MRRRHSGTKRYRDLEGVVVTYATGDPARPLYVVHELGTRLGALEAACERADRRGWRIQTVSSPGTILRDVSNAGQSKTLGRGGESTPERTMLSRIGRMDLLA